MPCCDCVAALKALQNSMMLTPRCPRAGPTGGLGLACPAGICNLISPMTFLAIALRSFGLVTFHLDELEFHGCGSSKDTDQHSQFTLVRFNLFDHAVEIRERAVDHLHVFAHGEQHPW